MSTPITRVSSAVSAIIAPVILNQMRLDERAAPGSEMRKVTKVIIPAAMTPTRQNYQLSLCESSEKISVPESGVCISSMLAATLSMVGALAMAALVMKTTPINRPPEAKNKKSWTRKTSSILLTMIAVGYPDRWNRDEYCRSAVFVQAGT